MRIASLFLSVALAGPVAAAPAAAPAPGEAERALFELGPKLLAGTLSLEDAAATAAIGYTGTAPRRTPGGEIPRAVRGEGTAQVVLASRSGPDGNCGVWFGGPDTDRVFKRLRKAAKEAGFKGGGPLLLGDGTGLWSFKRAVDRMTLVFIAGNAGGEVDFSPATTAIMMPEKGE